MSEPRNDPMLLRFFTESVEDREESTKLGSIVFKPVDMVEIRAVGSKDFMAKRVEKVEKHDAKLWGQMKDQYGYWKKGQEAPLEGTPLTEWSQIRAHHARTLAEHGVKTVEQAAVMNDETMKLIPMEGRRIQQLAAAYISADRTVERHAAEMVSIREEMSRMKADLAASQALAADLAQGHEKRGPGRPRKEEAA